MISAARLRELHETYYGEADRLERFIDEALLRAEDYKEINVTLPWRVPMDVAEIVAGRYSSVDWNVSYWRDLEYCVSEMRFCCAND